MELGITQPTNIHNIRSLIRTLKHVWDILQTEEAFTVKEYKHTHTHRHARIRSYPSFLHDMKKTYVYLLNVSLKKKKLHERTEVFYAWCISKHSLPERDF